jgi:hypothetical protein
VKWLDYDHYSPASLRDMSLLHVDNDIKFLANNCKGMCIFGLNHLLQPGFFTLGAIMYPVSLLAVPIVGEVNYLFVWFVSYTHCTAATVGFQ